MTDTICETRLDALSDAMDGEPWQTRLRAMDISQSDLAAALGITPTNLSVGLRGKWRNGEPQHLKALIIALEALSPAQRASWLIAAKAEAIEAELTRRERETKRKP